MSANHVNYNTDKDKDKCKNMNNFDRNYEFD